MTFWIGLPDLLAGITCVHKSDGKKKALCDYIYHEILFKERYSAIDSYRQRYFACVIDLQLADIRIREM